MKSSAKLFILIVGLMLFLIPQPAAAQKLENSGKITGTLVDGTNKNEPLAGQTVTLQMTQGETAKDLKTATTNEKGQFQFSDLITTKTVQYAAYLRFQGTQYVSDLLTLADKPEQDITLKVYQATDMVDNIAILQATILIRPPDANKSSFTVSEIYAFKNLSLKSYVGSLDAKNGKPNALLFSLPRGATNISLSSGFTGYNVIQVDTGFATDAALPPGDSEFSFTFEVPYNGTGFDFGYTAHFPTLSFSMMVPVDIKANAGYLTSEGNITAEQRPYQQFQATSLLPNQEVHMNLDGLPTPVVASSFAGLDNSTIGILIGLLIFVIILLVSGVIYRVQNRLLDKDGDGRPDRPNKKAHRRARAEKDAPARKKSKTPVRSNAERKKELLADLKELDESYTDKKISKDTYQDRRTRKKAQLRSLMKDDA